ncbi:hypothetical protein O988_03111 [Pseudogymnoascus sp. VKM F-3808]|nr:hypothetical protein O988_03111 [Pseudogymnoascus sp. VKM F-3808]
MHFPKLLPLAAFASLATADPERFLAIFYTKEYDKFGVPLESAGICVNLEVTGPKYQKLHVDEARECILYESRYCQDLIDTFYPADYYDISEYTVGSVQCYV